MNIPPAKGFLKDETQAKRAALSSGITTKNNFNFYVLQARISNRHALSQVETQRWVYFRHRHFFISRNHDWRGDADYRDVGDEWFSL